jgi:type IV secretion system protein VirB6
VMVLKVSGTMVSGWTVFGLARSSEGQDVKVGTNRSVARSALPSPGLAPGHPSGPRHGPSERQIRLPTTAPTPANDVSPSIQHGRNLQVAEVGAFTSSNNTVSPSTARARGVGSRFRAPAPTGLARSMEKSK